MAFKVESAASPVTMQQPLPPQQAALPASAAGSGAEKPSVIIISSSLQAGTRCQTLALKVKEKMEMRKITPEFLDLKDYKLPLCDGKASYGDPAVKKVQALIRKADVIIFAFPVYNDYCSAPAKNLIDLTGKEWENKVVGLIATAGSARSYGAPRAIANGLGYFSCRVISKHVYADKVDYPKNTELNAAMHKRLDLLVEDSMCIASAFKGKSKPLPTSRL